MSTLSILALDLSLVSTGVCLDGCSWRIDGSKLRGAERLSYIGDCVRASALGADLAVLEGYSFGSKGRALFGLGELGGVVRLELFRLGLRFVEVPPAQLKKYATGKGNAGKDEMLAAAIRRFDFAGSDNNEADAFLLYCLAREALGDPVASVPQRQAEAARDAFAIWLETHPDEGRADRWSWSDGDVEWLSGPLAKSSDGDT